MAKFDFIEISRTSGRSADINDIGANFEKIEELSLTAEGVRDIVPKTVMSPTMPPGLRPGDTWLEIISSAATGDRRVSMATIPTVRLSTRRMPLEDDPDNPGEYPRLWLVAMLLSDAADGDTLKLRRYRRRAGNDGNWMSRAGFVIPNPHRRPTDVNDGQYSFWLGDTGLPLEWDLSGMKASNWIPLFPVNKFKEIRQFAEIPTKNGRRMDYCFQGGRLNEDGELFQIGTAAKPRRALINFIVQREDQFGAPSNTAGVSFISDTIEGSGYAGMPGEPRVVFM